MSAFTRDEEIADVPSFGVLAGCSAMHFESSVASHKSVAQHRDLPVSASKNWILLASSYLSIFPVRNESYLNLRSSLRYEASCLCFNFILCLERAIFINQCRDE